MHTVLAFRCIIFCPMTHHILLATLVVEVELEKRNARGASVHRFRSLSKELLTSIFFSKFFLHTP